MERDSPRTREVVRRRMNDPNRDYDLRLFDAGILAAVKDKSGQAFLLKEANKENQPKLASVFWVIGHLYDFQPIKPQATGQQDATNSKRIADRPANSTRLAGWIGSE